MLSDLLAMSQPYLVTGYTDLRQGIDGLAGIVQGKLRLDPYSRAVFLFCGRRRDRIKGLLWEGDGFLLLYKRLDNGAFRWPRTETEALLLTEQQVRWLTDGLEIEQPKAIKPGKTGGVLLNLQGVSRMFSRYPLNSSLCSGMLLSSGIRGGICFMKTKITPEQYFSLRNRPIIPRLASCPPTRYNEL